MVTDGNYTILDIEGNSIITILIGHFTYFRVPFSNNVTIRINHVKVSYAIIWF